RLKKRHSALLVVHLESPNLTPRALIGAFSGATGPIGLVLTGPSVRDRQRMDSRHGSDMDTPYYTAVQRAAHLYDQP
ncbi:MAG: hypothetical protein JAY82_04465, partial [Candidatus Thiodiazotropha taylori]|nr:hypothetical protein [Candidatus Thiodiazotropha taylori]